MSPFKCPNCKVEAPIGRFNSEYDSENKIKADGVTECLSCITKHPTASFMPDSLFGIPATRLEPLNAKNIQAMTVDQIMEFANRAGRPATAERPLTIESQLEDAPPEDPKDVAIRLLTIKVEAAEKVIGKMDEAQVFGDAEIAAQAVAKIYRLENKITGQKQQIKDLKTCIEKMRAN